MKKILIYVVTVIVAVALGVFGCLMLKGNGSEPVKINTSEQFASCYADGYVTANVFDIVKQDKSIVEKVGLPYCWFETRLQLAGTVDTMETPKIVSVVNVFQTHKGDDLGYDTDVYFGTHEGQTLNYMEKFPNSFVLGDIDMNLTKEEFLPFDSIYAQLQKADVVKPVSKFVTLRQELKPGGGNPQWIFGNDKTGMVLVDAITGDVEPDKTQE